MIRHIVLWKLKDDADASREERIAMIRGAIEPLAELVPSVRALEIVENSAYHEANYEVALISDFDDVAGLDEYQQHPAHVEAAAIVRSQVASRPSVDFVV